MKVNEIAHLRIGFAQLDEGPVNKSERNFAYSIQEAQRRTALFVLEEKNGQQSWTLLDDDLPCSFERPRVYAYMAGPVYEAERGQRLVNGRVLNAESYIRFLKSVRTTDLTALKGARMTIDMWVRVEDELKLRHDDWFGWTFEPPCSLLFPPACAGSVPSLNLTGEPKVSKYLLLLLGKLLLTF